MTTLSAKVLEEKLKHGATTTEIANYFAVSEEQLCSKIEHSFNPNAYRGFMARMKKNDKRAHKQQSAPKTDVVETVVETEPNTSEVEESIVIEETCAEVVYDDVSLEALKSKRDELKELLNSLELKHKELNSQKMTVRNNIRSYKKKLEELKQTIQQWEAEIESLTIQLCNASDSMLQTNAEKQDVAKQLAEVEEMIKALQKLSIFFYVTGEISIEGGQYEYQWVEDPTLLSQLISSELANAFSLGEIKGLAKLIPFIKLLQKSSILFDIVFENAEIETLFNSIKE